MFISLDSLERPIAGADPMTATEKELAALTRQTMEGHPQLQYHQAFKVVLADRPDLNRRRTAEQRGVLLDHVADGPSHMDRARDAGLQGHEHDVNVPETGSIALFFDIPRL